MSSENRRTGIRVNLTLPEDVIIVLDRLAKATGTGRATIIREWLSGGISTFAEMARAVEMAREKNIDAFKVMSDAVGDAVNKGSQLQLEIKRERRAAMRRVKK
jgi:predicted DNA-binding protein